MKKKHINKHINKKCKSCNKATEEDSILCKKCEKNIKESKKILKDFSQFLNEEASLKGNVGIPGEDSSKKEEPKYLKDVENKAMQKMKELRFDPRDFMRKIDYSQQLQRGKEKELEDLARKIILLHYGNILKNVILDIQIYRKGNNKLKMEMESEQEQEQAKFDPLDDPEAKIEIDKRKITNNIVQGEAKNTKHMLHTEECKDGLIEIFGEKVGKEIHKIYDDITKFSEINDWMIPMEVQKKMWKESPEGFAGNCKVDFPKKKELSKEDLNKKVQDDLKNQEDEEKQEKEKEEDVTPRIRAIGIDFPMLLHESVKGIYELISQKGTPEDTEMAKLVSLNADVLSNELEDLRYGPYIAADLRDFVNKNKNIDKYPNVREIFFGYIIDPNNISSLDYVELIKGILMKTLEARDKVDEIINMIVSDLDKYEYDLAIGSSNDDGGFEKHEKEDSDVAEEEHTKEEETIKEKPKKEMTDEEYYSSLSKRDKEKLINKLLDDGNFEELKRIQKFFKESIENYFDHLDKIWEGIRKNK